MSAFLELAVRILAHSRAYRMGTGRRAEGWKGTVFRGLAWRGGKREAGDCPGDFPGARNMHNEVSRHTFSGFKCQASCTAARILMRLTRVTRSSPLPTPFIEVSLPTY
jgi:hypothetical protein